ncbi:MAG: cytochrome P450 [Ahrensia sp.]|nr:cytochrome P450 [Ahrensia sp.]
MTAPPRFDIDPIAFHADPYPALKEMRATAAIVDVPQLNALLMTRRDDIFTCEKNIDVFSSVQPGGLMTVLMGENMMRKDGEDHQRERKQAFPALSPRTVRDVWQARFEDDTRAILDGLAEAETFDVVRDFALPVCGNALRHMTGLTQLSAEQIDATSQAMIDGVGNYQGDKQIEARCHEATALLDAAIDERLASTLQSDDQSMVAVLSRAGQVVESIRANVKLAISGGQNEPRDAIAGAVWALLTHSDQLAQLRSGTANWSQVFDEYARWISPIGMSPRRIAKDFSWQGLDLQTDQRIFLMFSSANRDERVFDAADLFDVTRDTSKAVSFGAGPHFCAGAAASRTLIAQVALPMLFERFPGLKLAGDVAFAGWAFRGPLTVPAADS